MPAPTHAATRAWASLSSLRSWVWSNRTWDFSFERALELLGPVPSETSDESAAEVGFTVRLALHDLESEGDEAAAGAGLEALLDEADALLLRFPDVAWPQRKRGLVAQHLGAWLERRAALPARTHDERRADLERARGLYEVGAEVARYLEAGSWLLASELDLVQRCAVDLRRCDEALKRLEQAAGP